nr:Phage repressor [uncultured bacterium]
MRYDAEKARERNEIGARLTQARRSLRLTQGELAEALALRGVRVQTAAVSKWEKGDSVPSAYQLAAVCDALRIPLFGEEEKLNEEGRKMLAGYRGYLESQSAYRSRPMHREPVVAMKVSTLPASAGFGEALDNNLFESQTFPASSVPAGASFAVRVSGDSMEPVLHDGQYAWVEECSRLLPGEVGLFVVDGEGYIKVYAEQEPEGDEVENFTDSEGIRHLQPVLVSCNTAYDPKVITSGTDFRIVGRVLNA